MYHNYQLLGGFNFELIKSSLIALGGFFPQLWEFGEDVNRLLRKTVVQCEYDEQIGRYKANVREEMVRDDEIDRKQ
ncbi:hypothetical protein TSMEX_006739 [Taenia solium]|eukprot:TsM_000658600 transcript=TsM_000658600 gene=TsM_000658600